MNRPSKGSKIKYFCEWN